MSTNDTRDRLAANAIKLCEHDTKLGYAVETDDLALRAFEKATATDIDAFGRDAVLRFLKLTVRNWFHRQRTETGQPAYKNVIIRGKRVYVAATASMIVQLTVGFVLDRRDATRRGLDTAQAESDLWNALGSALPDGADRDADYGAYVDESAIAVLIEQLAA